jgi:hypothetical protein
MRCCVNSSGSTFADYVLSYFISPHPVSATPPPTPPSFFRFLQSLGIQTAAFEELTTHNMEKFNKDVPDRPDVKYYSFGASFRPTWGSVFRTSHNIIQKAEGENDGLVSVSSAVWGEYKGTIPDVNHLDIINWVRAPGVRRLIEDESDQVLVEWGPLWREMERTGIQCYRILSPRCRFYL